jgi:hypothetical protein
MRGLRLHLCLIFGRDRNSLLNPSILFGTRAGMFIVLFVHKIKALILFIQWEITNFSVRIMNLRGEKNVGEYIHH